ncbi:MAG: hypothetical protein CMO81_07490 [Waddliaceae bacterium]|nr:hypothetical protein [Waddliaceae bacterium]
MANLAIYEAAFTKYMGNLAHYAPDGILSIDLDLLQSLGILEQDDFDTAQTDHLARYFHVIESPEKITLFNEQFVIWIVPEHMQHTPITYALVALNHVKQEPQLEIVLAASGIYNTSRLVLRVLESILKEIQENEDLLQQLDV